MRSHLFLKIAFTALVFILFLSSCKKEEIERHVNEDLIIEGNTPPPYTGISEITVQNYINRLYIDLLGITPTQAEMEKAKISLKEGQYSIQTRENIIKELTQSEMYFRRFHEANQFYMLEGLDSADVAEQIFVFTIVKQGLINDGMIVEAQYVQLELDRAEQLQKALQDFMNGQISVNQYYRTFLNNFFYDEINMGSENFVIATFENFYNRFPTETELSKGVEMVDGLPSNLFFVPGNSKGDFMDITTTTAEFYTGWVNNAFVTFMLREPETHETAHYSAIFEQNKNISEIHRLLLKTDEYAGF